jgi:cyclophilin family peptidyl-prolyl cis-trans isomerase
VPLPKTVTAEKLTLKTDIGELTIELDGQWTPQATQRVVGLARAGFYDNTVVHRAVPGFIVQFGDPEGDGFGGAQKPPLRCETSPVPFTQGSVGVAISGRDTGSSQLFVTLGPYPHLNGEYTRLGTAEGPWNQLVPGDVITKITATPR